MRKNHVCSRFFALLLSLFMLIQTAPVPAAAAGTAESWSVLYDADAYPGTLRVELYNTDRNESPLVMWEDAGGVIRADKPADRLFGEDGAWWAVVQYEPPGTGEGTGSSGLSNAEIEREFAAYMAAKTAPFLAYVPENFPFETVDAGRDWYAGLFEGGNSVKEAFCLTEALLIPEAFENRIREDYGYFSDYPGAPSYEEYYLEELSCIVESWLYMATSDSDREYDGEFGEWTDCPDTESRRYLIELLMVYPFFAPEGYTPPEAKNPGAEQTDALVCVTAHRLTETEKRSGLTVDEGFFDDCAPLSAITPQTADGSPAGWMLHYLPEGTDAAIPLYIDGTLLPEEPEEEELPEELSGLSGVLGLDDQSAALTGRVSGGKALSVPCGSYLVLTSCSAGESDTDALLDWETVAVGPEGAEIGFDSGRSYSRLTVDAETISDESTLSGLRLMLTGGELGTVQASVELIPVSSFGGSSAPRGLKLRRGRIGQIMASVSEASDTSYEALFRGDPMYSLDSYWTSGGENEAGFDFSDGDLHLSLPAPAGENGAVFTEQTLVFTDRNGNVRERFTPGEPVNGVVKLMAGDWQYVLGICTAISMDGYDFSFLRTSARYADGTPITEEDGAMSVWFAAEAPDSSKTVIADVSLCLGESGGYLPDIRFTGISAVLHTEEGGDAEPPAVPQDFRVTCRPADTALDFAWTANREADLAGYRIYRTDSRGDSAVQLAEADASAASVSTDFDIASWGEAPWYFTLAAFDRSGNLSPQTAPIRADDPSQSVTGTVCCEWIGAEEQTMAVGTLNADTIRNPVADVIVLGEDNEGSLLLRFTPDDTVSDAELPETVSASLLCRTIGNDTLSVPLTLRRDGRSYTAETEIGETWATVRQAEFGYRTAVGTRTLGTLLIDRDVVSAMRVQPPSEEDYALTEDFRTLKIRYDGFPYTVFERGEDGAFTGQMSRRLYPELTAAFFTEVPETSSEEEGQKFAVSGFAGADSVTVSADELPQTMQLTLTMEDGDGDMQLMAYRIREDGTKAYADVSSVSEPELTDGGSRYVWFISSDPDDIGENSRLQLELYNRDPRYVPAFSENGRLFAEEGIAFRPGAKEEASAFLQVPGMDSFMYLELLAGEDGTMPLRSDMPLLLADENGWSCFALWHAKTKQLDTADLTPGAGYTVTILNEEYFRIADPCLTVLTDGSNREDPAVLVLEETAMASFDLMFTLDDVSLAEAQSSNRDLREQIWPELTVCYWDTQAGGWLPMPGRFTYAFGSTSGYEKTGACVRFKSDPVLRNRIDGEKGLKLVLGETADCTEIIVIDSFLGCRRNGSVKLAPGQVFYTVMAGLEADSGEGSVPGGIVSRTVIRDPDASDYLNGPALTMEIGAFRDDSLIPGTVEGLRTTAMPCAVMTAQDYLLPGDIIFLLRGTDGSVSRYSFDHAQLGGGDRQTFCFRDLPFGSYDIIVCRGESEEERLLETQLRLGTEMEHITLPASISACKGSAEFTEEDAAYHFTAPADVVPGGAYGVQGVTLTPDKDTVLVGDRLTYSLRFSVLPGGNVTDRTVYLYDISANLLPGNTASVSLSLVGPDGSRLSGGSWERREDGTVVITLPESDTEYTGTVLVSGTVSDGSDVPRSVLNAEVHSDTPAKLWQYYSGGCSVVRFTANTPAKLSSDEGAVSGRYRSGGTLNVRVIRQSDGSVFSQSMTANRYGYLNDVLSFPVPADAEEETFTVEFYDEEDGLLLTKTVPYAAQMILPVQVRIITRSGSTESVISASPGTNRDFGILNSAVLNFSSDYGATIVSVDILFDDSDPDSRGLTDARRVYEPLLALGYTGKELPLTYAFYPLDKRTYNYENAELGISVQNVPYSTAYRVDFHDYDFGVMDIGYGLYSSAAEQTLPAQASLLTPAEEGLSPALSAEIRSGFTELTDFLAEADGCSYAFGGERDLRLDGFTIGSVTAGELTGLTEEQRAAIAERELGKLTEEQRAVLTENDLARLIDRAELIPETAVSGASAKQTVSGTVRLLSEEEAAALCPEPGCSAETHTRSGDAGDFIRLMEVSESAAFIGNDSGGADLRFESSLNVIASVDALPSLPLLSAGTKKAIRLMAAQTGNQYVQIESTAVSGLADVVSTGVDTLLEKGSSFQVANPGRAADLSKVSGAIGTATGLAGVVKTGYDEIHETKREKILSIIQSYKDRLSSLRAALSRRCNCPDPLDRAAVAKLNQLDFEAQSALDELKMQVADSNLVSGLINIGASATALVLAEVPGAATAISYLAAKVEESEDDFEDFTLERDAELIFVKYEKLYAAAVSGCDNSKCKKEPEPLTHNNGAFSQETLDALRRFRFTPKKIVDPAGTVYEGMLSNPLSGVTVTIEYKGTDGLWHEWEEAPEYDHQQTVLTTDATGFYKWDVPDGLWRVRYEKEGYSYKGESVVYSEEMTVPPVWLDVNQKLESAGDFEASGAVEDGRILLRFTKPVQTADLTEEKITLLADGVPAAEGSFSVVCEENTADYGSIACKLLFGAVPEAGVSYTVRVTEVRSYMGTVCSFVAPVDMSGLTEEGRCAAVTAGCESGTVLGEGATVVLSCATEDAVIYYTLDGSCPCVESDSRRLYTGPIAVTEDTYIIAYAVKDGLDDSRTAAFVYFYEDAPDEWISGSVCADSHSVTSAVYADLTGLPGLTGSCDFTFAYYSRGRFVGITRECCVSCADGQVSIAKRFETDSPLEDVTVKIFVTQCGTWIPLAPDAELAASAD